MHWLTDLLVQTPDQGDTYLCQGNRLEWQRFQSLVLLHWLKDFFQHLHRTPLLHQNLQQGCADLYGVVVRPQKFPQLLPLPALHHFLQVALDLGVPKANQPVEVFLEG